ncbi:hypothetical protein D3C72_1728510 [compost metagenome]
MFMLASTAEVKRSSTPSCVTRDISASAGIQLAPRQKISRPLTRKAKRLPASSLSVKSSMVRKPIWRVTCSCGTSTVSSERFCAPLPAGHQRFGSLTVKTCVIRVSPAPTAQSSRSLCSSSEK